MRTWIKICGTTSLEDALSSIEAGANALGFIFAPSKRRVSVEQAVATLAPVTFILSPLLTGGKVFAA